MFDLLCVDRSSDDLIACNTCCCVTLQSLASTSLALSMCGTSVTGFTALVCDPWLLYQSLALEAWSFGRVEPVLLVSRRWCAILGFATHLDAGYDWRRVATLTLQAVQPHLPWRNFR